MLDHGKRSRLGDRGGAIFEFILVFPLLLSLAFGVWEFGRIIDALLVATNAAREGARFAVITQTTEVDPIRDRVMDYLKHGYGARLGTLNGGTCEDGDLCLNEADIGVVFLDDAGTPQPAAFGLRIQVTVPVKVRVFQSFLPGLIDPLTITGRESMLFK